MGMIQCPECDGHISDKALSCPKCGYTGKDPLLPVSEQNRGEIVRAEYGLAAWDAEEGMVATLGHEDKEALAEWMSDWDRFRLAVPELAQIIQDACAPAGKEYVAKLTPEIRRLMGERKLTFKVDKQGELMAALQDKGNVIRKQVRLEEVDLTPDIRHAVDNLYVIMGMNRILDEIQKVRDSVQDLHVEMRDDRLAAADAARERFLRAQAIRDTQLRKASLIAAADDATKAKNALMREFTRLQEKIRQGSGRPFLDRLIHPLDLSREADEALEDLRQIVVCVEVECAALSALEEYPAVYGSMSGFTQFAHEQGLDDIGNLLLIGEHSASNWTRMIERVDETVQRIHDIDTMKSLTMPEPYALITPESEEKEDETTGVTTEYAYDGPDKDMTDGDAADAVNAKPVVCRNGECGKRLSGKNKDGLCEHCREETMGAIRSVAGGAMIGVGFGALKMLETRRGRR